MKLFIVICFVTAVNAASVEKQISKPKDNVQLLKYENENNGTGTYKFSFEQSDGTKQEQEGELINEGTDEASLSVQGYYSWVGPDGVTYTVTYTADYDGFQADIDQGPGGSVPEEVVDSLG